MKFIATLALALFAVVPALAAPQDSASSSVNTASATISLTPQETCVAKCDPADVNCQAACVGTAHPNAAQANQTTECAMKCDQGDGSPEATQKYSDCVQSCISSYFPTTQSAAPAAGASNTAASNSANPTGTGAAATGTGASGTGASATGTGASSKTTGAASVNSVSTGAFGLAGLFMALFAL